MLLLFCRLLPSSPSYLPWGLSILVGPVSTHSKCWKIFVWFDMVLRFSTQVRMSNNFLYEISVWIMNKQRNWIFQFGEVVATTNVMRSFIREDYSLIEKRRSSSSPVTANLLHLTHASVCKRSILPISEATSRGSFYQLHDVQRLNWWPVEEFSFCTRESRLQ